MASSSERSRTFAGRFAGDDAAVVGVLGHLRAVLAGGVVETLLSVGDRGAVGCCAGAAGLLLLCRTGGRLGAPLDLTGGKDQGRGLKME